MPCNGTGAIFHEGLLNFCLPETFESVKLWGWFACKGYWSNLHNHYEGNLEVKQEKVKDLTCCGWIKFLGTKGCKVTISSPSINHRIGIETSPCCRIRVPEGDLRNKRQKILLEWKESRGKTRSSERKDKWVLQSRILLIFRWLYRWWQPPLRSPQTDQNSVWESLFWSPRPILRQRS